MANITCHAACQHMAPFSKENTILIKIFTSNQMRL